MPNYSQNPGYDNTDYRCGICDSPGETKTDIHYPEKLWFTCPECLKSVNKLGELESELATCRERLLESRRLYNDLQDYIKTLTR